MFAVFRADASPVLGGGQVMRCLIIAEALKAAGWRCGFVCNQGAETVIPDILRHDVLFVSSDDDASVIAQMVEKWPRPWDLGVIDHYKLNAGFENRLRAHAGKILVIDDLHDRPHDCDFLLDQTLGRKREDYASWVPPGCCCLLGTDYALLRPEFMELRAGSLERRKPGQPLRRVFISFGATDHYNIARRALEAI